MEEQLARILIAEDEESIRETLANFLEIQGYLVSQAENGEDALNQSSHKDFDLYLVDLMMPILTGEQFIKQLKIKNPDAMVIVLTAIVHPEKIVDIMRLGVFNYLVKPFNNQKLLETIDLALNYSQAHHLEKIQELSSTKEKQNDILWDNYKQGKLNKENLEISVNLINNLQATISQGSGFGSAMTLTDMIKMIRKPMVVEGEEKYLVDKEILDLLVSNNNLCRQQISSITNALSIFSQSSITLSPRTSGEVTNDVLSLASQLSKIAQEKKDCKFFIEPPKKSYNLMVNTEYMSIAFEEILINAMKFSLKHTTINVITGFRDGFFVLTCINPVDDKMGTITEEQEKLLLKPFLRLMPPVEDFYEVEKFGMGLGLSVVNQVIKLHNGTFSIGNIKEYISESSKKCVISEVGIPVI